MGGLDVRSTYLLGQDDEQYKDVMKAIGGIVFLATPHRGASSAKLLNNLLRASFQTPKDFTVELQAGSASLDDINDRFRHVAPKRTIASFYETQQTGVGKLSLMAVSKDSAKLGHSKDIERGLEANHQNVCKFQTPRDSNYMAVRSTLASFVKTLKPNNEKEVHGSSADDLEEIEKFLVVTSNHEEELDICGRPGSKVLVTGSSTSPSSRNGLNKTKTYRLYSSELHLRVENRW
ncbi:uncharacterized protein BDV14DRAFT_197620 [Aspergillus stella-maris]|uniref:uncharacterized protein n=1 Tax=Aspergillus stella-maris TaxID=1810926 RepID=UPI003CCC9969